MFLSTRKASLVSCMPTPLLRGFGEAEDAGSLLAHASVGCELNVQSQLLVRYGCGLLCAFPFRWVFFACFGLVLGRTLLCSCMFLKLCPEFSHVTSLNVTTFSSVNII